MPGSESRDGGSVVSGMGSMSVSGSVTASASASMSLPDPAHNESTVAKIPHILPHERVFPIQIGSELFKLSGASLSSDAPSYFSQYFLCQIRTAEARGEDPFASLKTLYIDRDPATFRDIALHLQGYHVQPRDGKHFVRLFADAQFYSVPKLISQLYEESIFISIGHREFQIPREILTDPGNSPNYFSLGFAFFFAHPNSDVFPGLDREGLIRPPSILPPSVPHRSAEVFEDLLRMLRGYPIDVRDETHRKALLRDARYFHFKGLEQKLIPHSITYNQVRMKDEIALRLENIQKSGISVARRRSDHPQEGPVRDGWVNYARPYVDERPAELVLEIGGETTKIWFRSTGPRAEFCKDSSARITKLFEIIAQKIDLPHGTSLTAEDGGGGVRVRFEPESAITLDGKEFNGEETSTADNDQLPSVESNSESSRKRRRGADGSVINPPRPVNKVPESWTVRTGQWRLRIETIPSDMGGVDAAVSCTLVAVKVDAVSSELARNAAKGFLGA